jgi:plastocyanin
VVRITFIGLAIGAALVLAACAGGASTAPSGGPGASAPAGGGLAVTIKSFVLPSVEAQVGQQITWTNEDSVGHTVTTDDGSIDGTVSGNGGTYSTAFATAGTYPYHCRIHPTMTGTITITG